MISVIVPVYNVEKYLKKCVDSILGQTYKDFELILIDDGSEDDSVEVIRKTAGSDERITLIDEGNKNQGAANARNRGVEKAKGRYICYIDADDLWSPDKLEKQLAFMSSLSSLSISNMTVLVKIVVFLRACL